MSEEDYQRGLADGRAEARALLGRIDDVIRCVCEPTPTGTRFHFRQAGSVLATEWGMSDRKGGALDELPSDLRIREYPNG